MWKKQSEKKKERSKKTMQIQKSAPKKVQWKMFIREKTAFILSQTSARKNLVINVLVFGAMIPSVWCWKFKAKSWVANYCVFNCLREQFDRATLLLFSFWDQNISLELRSPCSKNLPSIRLSQHTLPRSQPLPMKKTTQD